MKLIIDGTTETVEPGNKPICGWDEFFIIRDKERVSSLLLPVDLEPGTMMNTQGRTVQVPAE